MPVQQIVKIINAMDKSELETLLLLLSDQEKELLKRNEEFEKKKVKYLQRNEAFDG